MLKQQHPVPKGLLQRKHDILHLVLLDLNSLVVVYISQ